MKSKPEASNGCTFLRTVNVGTLTKTRHCIDENKFKQNKHAQGSHRCATSKSILREFFVIARMATVTEFCNINTMDTCGNITAEALFKTIMEMDVTENNIAVHKT
mmetsp:Transcript_105668/g.169985  ORF Transcript_105668/g.169985 Transcript_105668/m.169985 type:complete len:105 (-) Transcript_105668:40-354(-)